MTQAKTKKTAREKLELSRLRPDQLHGLGDVELRALLLKFKSGLGLNVIDMVTDITLERTIEGASTVTVAIVDDDREFLRSGNLHKSVDVEIDGLFFRLRGVRKQGKNLTLTFEDREVSILRTYSNKRVAQRTKMTRAEFILQLIKEVKEFRIPTHIPELHFIQPIANSKDLHSAPGSTQVAAGPKGFPEGAGSADMRKTGTSVSTLYVKGKPIKNWQLKNAAWILDTGTSMGARRKVLVCSIMTAIQESTLDNHAKNGDHLGLFQQDPGWGTVQAREDPAASSRAFFLSAMRHDKETPTVKYEVLCEKVQSSGQGELYAQWKGEAEALVDAYGDVGGDNSGSSLDAMSSQPSTVDSGTSSAPYLFYRGVPPTNGQGTHWNRENSWHCIQRLASEVNWRAFFVAGTFYFVNDDDLFKSRPLMSIDEESVGVESIDGDLDQNKKTTVLTVPCEIKRWGAPPGSVVIVKNMGPYNGRWLVTTVSRSMFNTQGTITLKRPAPALPEPLQGNVQQGAGGWTGPQQPSPNQFQTVSDLVQPVPLPYATHHGTVHPTLGLSGYPAIDFFGAPGSPVVAPEEAQIVRFSGHDPAEGPPLGVGGPLGWSIYLVGIKSKTEYYMTHLGRRLCKVGDVVGAAQQIATIADYDKYAGKGFSHTHVGVHGGSVTIEMLGKATKAVLQK